MHRNNSKPTSCPPENEGNELVVEPNQPDTFPVGSAVRAWNMKSIRTGLPRVRWFQWNKPKVQTFGGNHCEGSQ